MTGINSDYYSFLLRLWGVKINGVLVWRASLENPQTKEILGFESLPKLTKYLNSLTHKDVPEGHE